MNDTQSLIGRLVRDDQQRDAIHVAVAPMKARVSMQPGQRVDVAGDEAFPTDGRGVGIVDPFLGGAVPTGARCFIFLHPNTVTGMRHQWAHPAFANNDDERKTAAQGWMDQYAESLGSHSSELIERAQDYLKHGEYWSEGARFDGEYLPDDFWKHYQTITGETVSENAQSSFFSCSC